MIKVFLVEDEVIMREGIRSNIDWEAEGFEFVGEASDGELAYPLIQKSRPDILITDIQMPFMDGLSLSEMVKEEFPRTKIIIISGYDDFEYARRAIVAGVDQYLLKPITRAALRNVLLEIKEKIEQDMEQKDYQTRFQDEMQEFEQFSLRRFFEKILDGKLSVKEIYEEAAKLSLQIDAPCYNLLLFSFYEKENQTSGTDQNFFLRRQDEIFHYFLRHPQYILFRLNVNSYGVLIKSEEAQMEKLAENGICVLHDGTLHDYPSYNGSYDRAEETITDILAAYPSIKVVLDIHRDGIVEEDGTPIAAVNEINGKKAAQVMIISAASDGYYYVPNYLENFHFACLLQQYMEKENNGITRPILFEYCQYNQHLTTGSLLIEVGSQGNTLEQALYSGELIGGSIARALLSLSE